MNTTTLLLAILVIIALLALIYSIKYGIKAKREYEYYKNFDYGLDSESRTKRMESLLQGELSEMDDED